MMGDPNPRPNLLVFSAGRYNERLVLTLASNPDCLPMGSI